MSGHETIGWVFQGNFNLECNFMLEWETPTKRLLYKTMIKCEGNRAKVAN